MNKTAFITGASSGIGQAISATLKANGWNLIIPTHSELDLSNLSQVSAYADGLAQKNNHIDAFIHVAGIWHDSKEALADKKLSSFTAEQIIATQNVGITAPMVLIASLAPLMDGGAVIGISGTFENGGGGWLPYFTSKRALEDFLVGLSQDMPNLRVYDISPSDTATAAYAKLYPQYLDQSQPPQAVADLVLELLSEKHGYKSGDVIELKQSEQRVAFHA